MPNSLLIKSFLSSLLLTFLYTLSSFCQSSLNDLNIFFKHNFENDTPGDYLINEWRNDFLYPEWSSRQSELDIVQNPNDQVNPSKTMQINFPAKSLGPEEGGTNWWTMIEKQDEIYMSYDLYFMPGFQYQMGGKLPSFQGGELSNEGATGYDGFTGGLMFKQDGKIVFYIYYPDSREQVYGESFAWGEGNYGPDVFKPSSVLIEYGCGNVSICKPGEWHNLTYRMVLNTINSSGKGNYDGILEAYYDGRLVTQISHMLFRHTTNLKIDRIRMVAFFGGNVDEWRNPISEWLRVDNIMLYTFKDHVNVPRGNTLSPTNRTINYWRNFDVVDAESPIAPASLAVSSKTKSSIKLNWADKSANEQGFVIIRAPTINGIYTEVGKTTANVNTFTDQSLSPNTTYFYKIYAYNTVGNSEASAVLSVTTSPLQSPVTPSSLTSTAYTKNSVTLSWTDNASNEKGFEVYRSLSSSEGYNKIAVLDPNLKTYSDNQLTPSTTYYYKIRAFNDDGFSAFTPVLNVTTQGLQPPAAPSSLTSGTQTKYSITLNWADNAQNEQGFSIWRATSAGGEYTEIAKTATNATSYTNSNLNAGITYYYKIRAYNDDGVSAFTTALAATTKPLDPPAVPSELIASHIEYESATLVWKDNATNETGFELVRNLTGETTLVQVNIPAGATSYTDTSLNMNTSYQYKIRALNVDGTSAWSNIITVVTPRLLPPAPPTKLKSTKFTDQSISVTWKDNSSNENAFVITRSLAADPKSAVNIAIHANDTAFTDSSLVSSTTYQYTIKAVNKGGSSPASNKNVATTLSHAELKRVKEGLIAYYNFGFNPDYIVYDQSGYDEPLNLNILDRSAVNWNKDNTLDMLSNTAIVSLAPATKVIRAIKETGEITFECWLKPADPDFPVSSRIATLSASDAELGFAIDQQLTETANSKELIYHVRMQTASTVSSGYPDFTPDITQPYINLQHLVYTRNAHGKESVYLNGVKSSEGFRPSELTTWNDNYYLRLGNESDMNHSWTGSFYSVALFNKALSADEVMVNYSTGPCDSVEMASVDYSLSISPNPTNKDITVSIIPNNLSDYIPQTTIIIRDVYGKLLIEEQVFNPNTCIQQYFDLGGYHAGIYFVQVISGSKQKTAKVILQK